VSWREARCQSRIWGGWGGSEVWGWGRGERRVGRVGRSTEGKGRKENLREGVGGGDRESRGGGGGRDLNEERGEGGGGGRREEKNVIG